MLTIKNAKVQKLLDELILSFKDDLPLPPEYYDELQDHPEYGLDIMSALIAIDDDAVSDEEHEKKSPALMACFHYIEMCLIQLKLAEEHHQKWAETLIDQYQSVLLSLMKQYPNSAYWMPMINLFFEANITLNNEIKEMYIAIMESNQQQEDRAEHQQFLVQQLLSDDSEASEFEIAELFLAQTNALPQEYFPAFLKELIDFKLTKAINSAALFLLHPRLEIRDLITQQATDIFAEVTLPPSTMSRLLVIRHWLPDVEKGYIESLLAMQRKKGAEFSELHQGKIVEILATEMDGSGAQAIFLLIKRRKGFQAGGLLVKRYFGIKDTWLSPILSKQEAKSYTQKSLQGNFYLRKVDQQYLDLLIADHIYQAQKIDAVPHINLLKLQEITTSQWQAMPLNLEQTIKQLRDSLPEFDGEYIKKSLARSRKWYKKYYFTESWFDEGPELDKLVNQHSAFSEGVKVCDMSKALPIIVKEYFEPRREQWLDHFLWLTLWAKPAAKHNEYLWKDSTVIAQLLYDNTPLLDIPVMQIICEHSILQSLETMESRRTHLS